jgi:hypothetical protein
MGRVQMGRMRLSVHLMSILPWGQPEPPETTLVMLKAEGVGEEPSGMGVAREEAARARVASVYFIVEL